MACRAAADSPQVTGMVFEPFSEVEPISSSITKASGSESFARTDYHAECEAAINEQANIEYNVSYIYHAMWAYFDRDNVGLPGLAAYFKESSLEERGHAEMLMEYNNKRGGKVQLQSIMAPMTEFGGPGDGDKGDALYAMELALSLEKLNFQKLRALQAVADKHGDAQMSDFVESDLLAEQVDAVKEVATYVSQLRRVGKGHGVYQFDKTFR
uniref:Ferritin n=1 Tax=Tetraselmis chuii TaxID=63592 RepID=A0A7S1SR73_9CHLO